MNKKENEAVVNRFLLSSLYYILGLFVIYGLYRFSQSPKGFRLIYDYNLFYIISGVCILGLIASIIFKKKYYAVIAVIGAVCFPLLRVYWLVVPSIAKKMGEAAFGVLIRSQIPYAVFAVIITLFYIYECVYYALNVNQRTEKK